MSGSSGFSSTGPAAALAIVARRLGVRASPDALTLRFERHPLPQSLKALVEIAPELGVVARGFRSDVAGLADATLPAIVHMVDPSTGAPGFGVLVGRQDDGFLVQEESGAPPRLLSSAEFQSSWSGVVVTVELRPGAAVSDELSRGGLATWLRAWIGEEDPLTRATLVARWTGAVSLGVLCLVAAFRFGAGLGSPLAGVAALLVAALVAVGVAVSATLFFQSRRSVVPMGSSRLSATICGRGTFTDCLGVLGSRYARFAGIDWASVGIAFFSSVLLIIAVSAVVGDAQRRLLWAWLAVAALCALPEALVLIAVQVWPLRRFCPLCMTIHAVVLLSSGLAFAYLLNGGWPEHPLRLLPWAALHAAAFLGAFGLVVGYLAYSLEARVHRVRLGWIGSSPLGALAEMAGRPPAVRSVPEPAIRIGPPSASIRLDALVHPVCSGCGPVVSKLAGLAARHVGRITVGLHVAPRDALSRADRELCTALSAVGLMTTGEEAFAAFLRVKADPWPVLREAERGAAAVVAGLLQEAVAPPAVLLRAWEAVEAADQLAERLERGTPTLLVGGRLWDGSVEEFDRILSEQPALLASILGVAMEAAAASNPVRP